MNIEQFLQGKEIIITDGSMGTYLEILGYSGITPEFANIDAPGIVASVHDGYMEAGASVILTNTFGANEKRLSRKKLAEQMESINMAGVEIALAAREKYKGVLVAGDIGPTGELLAPYGNLEINEAEDVFSWQASLLEEAGVDFILLETFQDIVEMNVAYDIIREKTGLFVLPSFALSQGGENRTLMGQRIEDLLKWSEKTGILGINCGLKSGEMKRVVSRIKKLSDIPLWVKPNGGIPEITGGKIVYPESAEEFADNCAEMAGEGVKFIGGCCGTTPHYIKVLKKVLDEKN